MKKTKKHSARLLIATLVTLVAGGLTGTGSAQDEKANPLTVAVLNFEEKGNDLGGIGESASILLTTFLSDNPNLILVERAELENILAEFELNLSGTVDQENAAKIGQLTGARILVTGRVFPVGKQNYLVAKIISVETGRVFGESAKFAGVDELEEAVMALKDGISETLDKRGGEMFAKVETPEERLGRLKKLVEGKALPKVYVNIPEEHITTAIPDPAAETEIRKTLQDLGFPLVAREDAAEQIIEGEAFSEVAGRRGNLISCRARVEVKIHKKNSETIKVERQTSVAVDIAETVAAKSALEKAGMQLAERLLPLLVE